MSYFNDAKSLVEHASKELPKLERAYEESLHQEEVQSALKIEIKNIMENLRSALDFAARGLFDKYGFSNRSDQKIYFPYALLSQTKTEFHSKKRIEKSIPGIELRHDIVAKLDSYQHYSKPGNRWLPLFMELNDENKHERLTPQTREETRERRLESVGASISLGEGAIIRMGPNTSIRIGNMVLPGDQEISVDRPAQYIGEGSQKKIIWVSFKFESNGELVIPFIKNSIENTRVIVDELEVL